MPSLCSSFSLSIFGTNASANWTNNMFHSIFLQNTLSKEDIAPVAIEISMATAIFTNTFCPPCIFFQKRYNRYNG